MGLKLLVASLAIISIALKSVHGTSHCDCMLVLEPVCGSDGKTYVNPCGLNCAARENSYLRMAHDGACVSSQTPPNQQPSENSDCQCDMKYEPVCDSNGKTHRNRCMFDCEFRKNPGKRLSAFGGPCDRQSNQPTPNEQHPEQPECLCPMNYEPVCDSDGKTHPNQCTFNCEFRKNPGKRLSIAYSGECVRQQDQTALSQRYHDDMECQCELKVEPLCDSNGQTHPNRCAFDCEVRKNPAKRLSIAYPGECVPRRGSEDVCPRNYDPVCDSDGNTHSNSCMFRNEMKKDPSRRLRVVHAGACVSNSTNSEPEPEECGPCPANYDPVCGSDGKTYPNSCALDCGRRKDRYKLLRAVHKGECSRGAPSRFEQPCECPDLLDPVCGTDHISYRNECKLNCEVRKNPSTRLSVAYRGVCTIPINYV